MRYYGVPLLVSLILVAITYEMADIIPYMGPLDDLDMLYTISGIPCGWAVLTRLVRRLKGGKGYIHPFFKVLLFPVILFYWYVKMIPSMFIGFFAGPYYLIRFVIAAIVACRTQPVYHVEQVDATGQYDDEGPGVEEGTQIGFVTPRNKK